MGCPPFSSKRGHPSRGGPVIALLGRGDCVREITCHSAHRAGSLLAFICLAALLSLTACRRGVPVIDTAPKPQQADGTISGTVRGPAGTTAIDSRAVAVINVDTGERQSTTTNNAGGFTFKVPPGRYRVELALRDGEALVKQPGVMNVDRSDIDAHADFVVGASGVARPRYHAPRSDDGLGSAIA